ncbi:hypothetical protein L0Y65_06460 [Candidatus Micrarchaeota archaeon]|nr:hypothetical protein [Candidatus Micrarchaeota archaeon]
MRGVAPLALVLLFFAAAAYATDGGSLSSFFNNTTQTFNGQGRDFVEAAGAGGQLAPTTFNSVYDAFGPGNCGDSWISAVGGVSTIVGMWYAPAILVVMMVLLGLAIIYMYGQVFNSPQMIALAKDELFQTSLTVGRVMFLVAMLSAGEMWYALRAVDTGDRSIYNNPNVKSTMDASMAFARLMVSDMVSHYGMLVMYNMVIHTLYSSTMWVGVTWRAMYQFNLGPVLKPLIDLVGSALQFLSLGISEWMLHIVTLCLIKKWTWGLFIPLSMLLRAFPYTRSAGEALFALVFALALFYPFMFLFDYEVHKLMKYNLVDAQKAMGAFLHKSGIMSLFGSVLVMMFLMAGVFMPFFLGGALNLAFELIRGSVYYIVIIGIFLPFINIFVTLTAAKEIANFFRVDVNFMSFLKII